MELWKGGKKKKNPPNSFSLRMNSEFSKDYGLGPDIVNNSIYQWFSNGAG